MLQAGGERLTSQDVPRDARAYVRNQGSLPASLELKGYSTDGPSLSGWGDENGGCDSRNHSQATTEVRADVAPGRAAAVPLRAIYDIPEDATCSLASRSLDAPLLKRARLMNAAESKPEAFGELMDKCIKVPRRRRTVALAVDKGHSGCFDRSSGSPGDVRTVGIVWSAAGSPFDERAVAGLLSLRDALK